MFKRGLAVAVLVMVASGCAADRGIDQASIGQPAQRPNAEDSGSNDGAREAKQTRVAARPTVADPRENGFEIALGEWAVTPEAPALRPGEVTFVIHNRGTMPHGFEIELEGESSGSGSGELFKAESELIRPGESTRMTVTLLQTGIYKIECLVDGHDDMGLEGPLEVSTDAPLQKSAPKSQPDATGNDIAISNFAFQPKNVSVAPGSRVTWANEDPAQHTVTSLDGAFDSDILDGGSKFSFTFDKRGIYGYRCNVHPDMTGTVTVR